MAGFDSAYFGLVSLLAVVITFSLVIGLVIEAALAAATVEATATGRADDEPTPQRPTVATGSATAPATCAPGCERHLRGYDIQSGSYQRSWTCKRALDCAPEQCMAAAPLCCCTDAQCEATC